MTISMDDFICLDTGKDFARELLMRAEFDVEKGRGPDALKKLEVLKRVLKRNAELEARVVDESLRNQVTGAYGLGKLQMDFEYFVRIANDTNEPFAVFFADADFLKLVNKYDPDLGHLNGHKYLRLDREYHEAMFARSTDVKYSHPHGDEMITLVPGMNEAKALEQLKRLEDGLSTPDSKYTMRFIDGMKLQLSVSFGFAVYRPEQFKGIAIPEIFDAMHAEANHMMVIKKAEKKQRIGEELPVYK
jgi:diguanylate cyclase (GGDEF)-like protein